MNVRFYLSYDIKITLKYHFWRKNVLILSLCTRERSGSVVECLTRERVAAGPASLASLPYVLE